MRLAIMQPYIFPYLGYFQLIHSVDTFVIYDDVSFIKHGWINRNNILLNGKSHRFSIPLKKLSSFTKISDTIISDIPYNWDIKLLATIMSAYQKAPYFSSIYPLIKGLLSFSSNKSISVIAAGSIYLVAQYLNIKTSFINTSSIFNNNYLKGELRVIDICRKLNASHYINSIGGLDLYSKLDFLEQGIELNFIKSNPISYSQFKNEFVPCLSILDVLMFNSPQEINVMLDQFELL
jgi:hypothetical protein